MVNAFIGGFLLVAFIGLSAFGLISRRQKAEDFQSAGFDDDSSADDVESSEEYLARLRFQTFSHGEDTTLPDVAQWSDTDQR